MLSLRHERNLRRLRSLAVIASNKPGVKATGSRKIL